MIQIGLIGCGRWGVNLFRNALKLNGARLRWVCDADPEKLLQIKQQYPDLKTTPVFTTMLNDPELDGVLIATPPATHYEIAKCAFQAEKHAFVEKPLALSYADAQSLVECAQEKQKILMVGHLLRYHPAVMKLKRMLKAGELGDVFYVYSQRLNLGVIRRFENALWNLACHDISVILHLMEDLPNSVSAMGQCYAQQNVEDTVFLNLHFGKKMAHIHVSWLDPHKVRKLTVVGSKKMAVFDDMEPSEKITVYNKGFVSTQDADIHSPIEIREGLPVKPKVSQKEPLFLELQHFADAIRLQSSPWTDGAEGAAVVRILEAAQRSMEKKSQPVPIEWPAQENLTSVNEWLDDLR